MIHRRRIGVGAMLVLLSSVTGLAQSLASTDKTDALADAARKGDAAIVKKLLDEGVNVNTKYRYNATALSYASDRGHVDVVKLLIDRGADVNVKDTFYNATPLTWAVNPAMGRCGRGRGSDNGGLCYCCHPANAAYRPATHYRRRGAQVGQP